MSRAPAERVGRYAILEPLGRGGMSRVDLARRTTHGAGVLRLMAIKRLLDGTERDPRQVRMLIDEARVSSVLNHPNIAQIYDFGRTGNHVFLAMEFVPGVSLRALLRGTGGRGFPLRIALTIVARVLEALSYAHTRTDALGRPLGIVHRDVNPRNVLVSVAGEVKLIDFGVASANDRLESTLDGEVKGKLGYMPPEQLDDRPVDGRADVFAVGLLMYELVTGQAPFAGLSSSACLRRSLEGEVPALPKQFPLLLPLYDRATARLPEDRYESAAAFLADVTHLLALAGGPAPASVIASWMRSVAPAAVEEAAERVRRHEATWTRPSGVSLEALLPRAVGIPRGRAIAALAMLAGTVATLLFAGW